MYLFVWHNDIMCIRNIMFVNQITDSTPKSLKIILYFLQSVLWFSTKTLLLCLPARFITYVRWIINLWILRFVGHQTSLDI